MPDVSIAHDFDCTHDPCECPVVLPNLAAAAVRRRVRQVQEAAESMASEHPLDSLLADMREHGWSDDDPMVRWVREAMVVPYPMPRWEAYERGLLPLTTAATSEGGSDA